ncbi:MAG TPA: macro domain-containing protein [Thermoanaerobaculia bacterium]
MATWKSLFPGGGAPVEGGSARRPADRWLARPAGRRRAERPPLVVSLWVGDLAEAPAAAICTSTNPRLSLLGGTGGAVLLEAGPRVKREAQALLERRRQAGHEEMEVGSVHPTSAGTLPHDVILHCVASDSLHRSSPAIVRRCVEGALAAADAAGATSVAMPVFGTGHASLDFAAALGAMAESLAAAATDVEEVVVVLPDADRLPRARQALDATLAATAEPG